MGHKGQDRQRPRPPPHGLCNKQFHNNQWTRTRALEHWKAGFGSVSAKLAGTRKVSNLLPSSPARTPNQFAAQSSVMGNWVARRLCLHCACKTNNSCVIRVCRECGHGAFISQPGEKAIPAVAAAAARTLPCVCVYERWARAVHVISHLKRETLHSDRADSL